MTSQDKSAILLVAYGSLSQRALETYDKIISAYRKEFSQSSVNLAFTSNFIRRRLSERNGVVYPSPLMALAHLQDQGSKKIVVQSLQAVPGSEFHQTASIISGLGIIRGKFGFERLEMGMPLLSGIDDCRSVSAALEAELGMLNKEKKASGQVADSSGECCEHEAVVLMGHGTTHVAESAYSQMAAILEKDYGNVFLGTIDAFPGVEEILVRLNKSGIKRIKLMPFLLVAGGHAQEDLAGDGTASWKSIFAKAGIQTEVHLKGLAENSRILGIFLEHTKQATERLEKSRAAKD